jgi:hypothetical protein
MLKKRRGYSVFMPEQGEAGATHEQAPPITTFPRF